MLLAAQHARLLIYSMFLNFQIFIQLLTLVLEYIGPISGLYICLSFTAHLNVLCKPLVTYNM